MKLSSWILVSGALSSASAFAPASTNNRKAFAPPSRGKHSAVDESTESKFETTWVIEMFM